MEHTNKIAIKILCDEYYDYAHDPECKWHYDRQYKMLVKAIEMASAGKNELNTSEPHLTLGGASGQVCVLNKCEHGYRSEEGEEYFCCIKSKLATNVLQLPVRLWRVGAVSGVGRILSVGSLYLI